MPLTSLTSIIDQAGRDPLLANTISVVGTGNGGDISQVPVEQQFPQMAVNSQFDGRVAAHWTEDRNAYVKQYKGSTYMAISAIAKMVAMQDVVVQRRTEGKSGVKLERVKYTHPLQELFEEINPIDTLWDLWFYAVGWRLTTGNSMIYKAKNGFGITKQLWPMPSQWCKAIPDPENLIAGYEVSSGPGNFYVHKDAMIDIKNPSLDWQGHGRFYGQPSIKAAAVTIELENQMYERLYYTFKNFAPPGMVFSTEQRLQPHQVHQLWANIAAQHSMSEHSGRPMITHSGLKLESSFQNSSQKELDYIGSLDKTLEITLATHGVPKAILGMVADANKSNMEGSLIQFCKMTIDPILKQFSQHFTQDLAREFTDDKSLVVKIGPSSVDKEAQMVSIIEMLIKAGAVTPNEAREVLMDWDPLDSPHGEKAVMVSGFQAIDSETGLPDQGSPSKSPDSDPGVDSSESERTQVGRSVLGGRH